VPSHPTGTTVIGKTNPPVVTVNGNNAVCKDLGGWLDTLNTYVADDVLASKLTTDGPRAEDKLLRDYSAVVVHESKLSDYHHFVGEVHLMIQECGMLHIGTPST
jgi:hypothetical protein